MNPLLNLNIDINTALQTLTTMKDKGESTVPMPLFLKFTLPRIENSIEKMDKIKRFSDINDIVTVSWLANNLGVTRQTIYNWKANGYLIFNDDGKISLKQTLELWDDFCWLGFL